MKQTQEKFEAMNLEYENLQNEEDDRRDYNSVWYSQVIECSQTIKGYAICCRISSNNSIAFLCPYFSKCW